MSQNKEDRGTVQNQQTFTVRGQRVNILLVGKNPDAGRVWGQEEKGTTEDERKEADTTEQPN